MITKADIGKPLYTRRKSTIETGSGMTEQSHKDKTDINLILMDYKRTGLIKHAKQHEGKYDDVSAIDFQESMFKVTQVQSMFNQLPSDMRNQFNNDPAQFLAYVQDKSNADNLAKMGIIRGNDGIDINGAAINSPVEADVTPPIEAGEPPPPA